MLSALRDIRGAFILEWYCELGIYIKELNNNGSVEMINGMFEDSKNYDNI